jgi:hypothetical protein
MTEAILDNNKHAHTEAKVTKSSKPISRRDRETLRRLIKSHTEAELNDLISQERDQLVAPGRPGAPRIPKFRQAFLAALYYSRYCSSPCTVRAAATDIDKVVEISFLRVGKKPKYRKHKSLRALEEDLRSGLRDNNQKEIAAILHGLIWWRQTHVDPAWGSFMARLPINISFHPKKPLVLIRWIDALIATMK